MADKDRKQAEADSFQVIDKRKFTMEGELRDDVSLEPESQPQSASAEQKKTEEPPREQPKRGEPVESPAFPMLVEMLAVNAAMYLGEGDALQGRGEVNLDAARQFITLLDVLTEKTRGNLTPNEERFLNGINGELKMKFVQKSGSQNKK